MLLFKNAPKEYHNKLRLLGSKKGTIAVTISPPSRDWKEMKEAHYGICCALTGRDYFLVAEFTDDERLHYHGLIAAPFNIPDRKRLEVFGFVDISLKPPGMPWIEYMFKDYRRTVDLMGCDNYSQVIYTPFNFRFHMKDPMDEKLLCESARFMLSHYAEEGSKFPFGQLDIDLQHAMDRETKRERARARVHNARRE